MNDFHFLHPLWLLAIIPVLLLWWGFLRAQAARNSVWADVIDPHLLSHLLVKAGPRSRLRPVHVLATMMTLSAVALAGPSFRLQPSPFLDDEAGLMIVLKVTPTMNSEDVQPTRLTRAKQKVHDLIESRRGSSTGLIVYSGTAHLVMPLTKDSTIITTMIEDLGPETMPQDGDALRRDSAEQVDLKAADDSNGDAVDHLDQGGEAADGHGEDAGCRHDRY